MKFTVHQEALLDTLSLISKGFSSSSADPLQGCLYLEAKEGMLELQSNNQNIFVRTGIPANVEAEGACVVSGRLFSGIIKTLPDAAVYFEMGGRVLKISCEKSLFNLSVQDISRWTPFPEFKPETYVELPYDLLSGMVSMIYRMTSKDLSHQILQGILLTAENNVLRLVATDGFRLGVCDSITDAATVEGFSMVIPGVIFHDILSCIKTTESVGIGFTQNQVLLRCNENTVVMRRIEGNYPNYKQLIPTSCKTSVVFDTKRLLESLRRMSVFAYQDMTIRMEIDTEQSRVMLVAKATDQGESCEELKAEVTGESVSTALNYHYLTEALSKIPEGESVTMGLLSPSQPVVFTYNGKINYLNLIMPMRV